MKKLNILGTALLGLALLTGCKEESIVLTSELPQFETRDGLMLLEGIVPYGTGINDQIYIYGDFNGGEEAIGNPEWLLQRGNPQTGVPAKFGIYLNPNSFVNGKTLADGYSFYNIQSGPEVDLEGNILWHYDYPALGQRLNVFIDYWEDSFNTPENPDDVEHDGYAIYVINNTGWTDLALYAWGDAEAFGGWPGIGVTGKVELNGVTYQYFDTGADNEGLNLNLIFNNNNNGSQLPDYNVTLNKDYYFELTADGAVEIDPNASITHDGYAVFVYDSTGWDSLALYMWGDVNDLNGGWPGMQPTGTVVINGIGYVYFDFGEANTGLNENLIFNNNDNGSQLPDFNFTIDRNLYVEITSSGVTEINPDDFQPGGNVPDEPTEPDTPSPSAQYNIYIQNETGWENFYLYAWGDSEIFNGWPGQSSTETITLDGIEYLVFTVEGIGETEHLIFNNNAGIQIEQGDMVITLDQNWFIKVTATEATFLETPNIKIYADNKTTWEEIALYAWSDGNPELFGGWPGLVSTTTETVNGVEYLVYPAPANGLTYNLIFNNNNHQVQLDNFPITLNQDVYLEVTDEGVKFKE
ncbi:MAG: starch-binding protein [Muribaculaceae bacterium]|nr:starch-binding protein [Muribaculaceae bacterium]